MAIIPSLTYAQDYLLIENSIPNIGQQYLYSSESQCHAAIKQSLYFDENYPKGVFEKPILLDKNNTGWFERKLFTEHFGVKRSKQFVIIANPLLNLDLQRDLQHKTYQWVNTRGIMLYGAIDDKISFSSSFYETQADYTTIIQNYYQRFNVLPGQQRVKPYQTSAYDWGSAYGSITIKPFKHLHFQMGTDKNFIGDGYRSMLLSDYAPQYLYVKATGKIGKFYYQNILASLLNPNYNDVLNINPNWTVNSLYPRKTMSIIYLGYNLTPNLQIGLFESVIFEAGKHSWDLNAINPIPLVRSIQFASDSIRYTLTGLNICAKLPMNISIYGQYALDNQRYSVFQVGSKTYNLANIKNWFTQIEYNWSQQGAYMSQDASQHYGHYNQPLAHPAGNGFSEILFRSIYSYKRLNISTQASKIWYRDANYQNIFLLSDVSALPENGYQVLYLKFEPAFVLNKSYNLMIFSSVNFYKTYGVDQEFLLINAGIRTSLRNIYHDF